MKGKLKELEEKNLVFEKLKEMGAKAYSVQIGKKRTDYFFSIDSKGNQANKERIKELEKACKKCNFKLFVVFSRALNGA